MSEAGAPRACLGRVHARRADDLPALIGGRVLAAVAALAGRTDRPGAAESPEGILRRRLASGEIDADTYDELRAKLR